ncbi:uncharacterized protein [Dermacentor andersoni]|uniref:uncharacterized protein isoform X2 n=1 Tax=Dermacentor andersoni TaxID=34620 RepID=UPI0024172464|nr:uncharacterized protein LOC126521361 isoform X2 [Dermacentor andersoni]
MNDILGTPAYHNEESKKEFQSAKDKPGIHIYNPKTPVELHLPGGIQKFNDVLMECTFRKDMKTVVYEWWWSKRMDFPLFEVTSEQYTENKLQYYIEDYNTKSKDVDNRDFYYVLGQETRTKFNYHVKDRYLVPVPLSLPLTSAGILKGDLYEIKGKNPRNAEEFRLVFGDQSLQVPLGAEHEEFTLEVKGEEDGLCTAKLNGVELPGVVSKGPFLADRMVLEGDVDFHWVIITKPGGPEAAIEDSKEKDPAKEETKEKDEDSKA